MFRSFSTSWQLVKASAAVLRSDKQLIVYPIVSAVGTLLVVATFLVPLWAAGLFDRLAIGRYEIRPFEYVVTFLFYLVLYFVIIFANTALVGAALIRLQGGKPTLAAGFGIALQHVGTIFGYALLSATVGILLRAIAERTGWLGRIATSILGLAWSVATFLVVPILVVENVGPIAAVKRSSALLKRTWGEQIIGNIGIGAVMSLLTFLTILLGMPVIALAASTRSVAALAGAIAVVLAAVIILSLIGSALSGIYRAALYRYAATGEISGGFDPALVQNAFRTRESRRLPF